VRTKPPSEWSKFTHKAEKFFMNNFSTVRFFYTLSLVTFSRSLSLGRPRARWTIDPVLLKDWGERGLAVAAANLDKVVEICRDWKCRVTLVVYPWPDNIAARDQDSLQVRHWRAWAAARGVRFVDGFAPFFSEPADAAIARYYIPGDVHFTPAGNRALYDTVRVAIDGDW
jgi:hypothetical protein